VGHSGIGYHFSTDRYIDLPQSGSTAMPSK
jgi:hypothetical protein